MYVSAYDSTTSEEEGVTVTREGDESTRKQTSGMITQTGNEKNKYDKRGLAGLFCHMHRSLLTQTRTSGMITQTGNEKNNYDTTVITTTNDRH